MSTCRSCGADIFWAHTDAGKLMPIDAEPNPDGNVELGPVDARGGRLVLAVHAQAPLLAPDELWMPHFATCPDGPSWSKG